MVWSPIQPKKQDNRKNSEGGVGGYKEEGGAKIEKGGGVGNIGVGFMK